MCCVNHGPTTCLYYKNPVDNKLGTQVDNFDTTEEANDFMRSKLFAENLIGTDFDEEDMICRLRAGQATARLS